jgi:aromatic-L-amino-acid decarboxylase
METKAQIQEENLDPQDWQSLRSLGHRMLDDMLDYLENVRERPVWQPMPDAVRDSFKGSVPLEPEGAEQAYRQFQDMVLPYTMGNTHPRFWGWVMGNGTVLGVLADMLASALNPNMGGGDHAPVQVEQQVIDWCKQIFAFPAAASGLLVSGGSMANLVGLAVARNARAEIDIRQLGIAATPRRMTFYGSREMHSSLQKAVELMGLGNEALRRIPVNERFEIDLAALKQAILNDRANGLHPVCVIGNAGTVNTGAIDDLESLADLCATENLWLHVDGAFGALATLSPNLRGRVKGIERADSLAFDLHKWMYLPFEAGCVLVKDADAHRKAFSLTPDYLAHGQRGLAGGSVWFSDYGIQLTRGFRALKVWMSLKEHGARKFGRLIEQNVDQAVYLGELVDAAPELERLAPVTLNIVCFRFIQPGMDENALNALNQELLIRLHESGIAAPSYTTLNGKYALRAAITNHRSRREDFDILVEAVIRLGRQLAQ